jgi:hypothetical protein
MLAVIETGFVYETTGGGSPTASASVWQALHCMLFISNATFACKLVSVNSAAGIIKNWNEELMSKTPIRNCASV